MINFIITTINHADALAADDYFEATQCGDRWEERSYPFSFTIARVLTILRHLPAAVEVTRRGGHT